MFKKPFFYNEQIAKIEKYAKDFLDDSCAGKKVNNTKMIKLLADIEDIRIKRFVICSLVLYVVSKETINDKQIDIIYTLGQFIGVSQDKIDDFFIWAAQGLQWHFDGNKLIDEDL